MKTIKTHTGKIYVDSEKKLEFLTVGDYGKENNIKANFLGLTKEINGVANTEVDLSKKWVATISTQKGCPMKCKFCDVPRFGFHGNASLEELAYQIRTIIENESVLHTERFNVHFARMGEPTWNENVPSRARPARSFTASRTKSCRKSPPTSCSPQAPRRPWWSPRRRQTSSRALQEAS